MSRLSVIGYPQFARLFKVALAAIAVVLALTGPAYAGSALDDAKFLAALDRASISYDTPGQAIAAGNAVCQLMDEGRSATEVVWQLVVCNQALSADNAATFAGIATNVYCPQHQTNFSQAAG